MKKLFAVAGLFAAMLMANPADAQIKVGAGVMLGLPMGTLADNAGFGFGGGINGAYMLNDNMSVGVTFGYVAFGAKSSSVDFFGTTIESESKTSATIYAATYDYYFMPDEDINFYAGVTVGGISYAADVTVTGGGLDASTSASEGGYLIAPHVGLLYALNDTWSLNGQVAYNLTGVEFANADGTDTGNGSFLGINIGVVYTIE